MNKQSDNPYFDLMSLSEWTDDKDKKIVLLSHYPHLAKSLSIRGMYEHFYEDAKRKESFLHKYFSGLGLNLTSPKDRMADCVKQFIV